MSARKVESRREVGHEAAIQRQQTQRSTIVFVSLILFLGTLAIYWPALSCEFVHYDDPQYVTENPNVFGGLTWGNLKWAFTTGYAGNWIPLTWVSHMLDCQLFGLNPARHHLTSVLIHAANVALIFFLLWRTTKVLWCSILVAALFASHPLRVESVTWISERKDVLCAFFGLLSLCFYSAYAKAKSPAADKSNSRSKGALVFNYLLALFCFVLGLLAKPMLITWPFVLLLLDFWPLNRFATKSDSAPGKGIWKIGNSFSGWFPLVVEKIPFFALSAALIPITMKVQTEGDMVRDSSSWPMQMRAMNAVISYARYMGKTLWPVDLTFFYQAIPLTMGLLVISAAILVCITIFALRVHRNHRFFLSGWFWFLGVLFPVIGLVKNGDQSIADRFTYLPSIGLLWIVVWGWSKFPQRIIRTIGVLIAAGLIVAWSCVSVRQISYWKTSRSLFTHALTVEPDNGTVHVGMGVEEYLDGHYELAEKHFRKTLERVPKSAEAHCNLATLLHREGHLEEAKVHFVAALNTNPRFTRAAYNFALLLKDMGRLNEAIEQLQTVLSLEPTNRDAKLALTDFLRRSRATPEESYERGISMVAQGKSHEAIPHFREALQLKPDWVEPMNELAWILATDSDPAFRDGVEALKLALRACELNSRPEYLGTLDAAYAETGRFKEAIETAEKARQLFNQQGETNLAAMAEERVRLYRAGKPFHSGK